MKKGGKIMSDLYNVGRIGMSIETINDNSVSNIEKVIRKLNTLNKLDKNVLETFNSINRLGNGLYKVQKIKSGYRGNTVKK